MHIHMHTYTHTHTHIYIYIYIYIYIIYFMLYVLIICKSTSKPIFLKRVYSVFGISMPRVGKGFVHQVT